MSAAEGRRLNERGLCDLRAERFQEAIDKFYEACEQIKDDGEEKEAYQENIAVAFFEWGQSELKKRRYSEAIQKIGEARYKTVDGDSQERFQNSEAGACSEWGLSLLKARRFSEAIVQFQLAQGIASKSTYKVQYLSFEARVLDEWGRCLFQEGNFGVASAKFQAAAEKTENTSRQKVFEHNKVIALQNWGQQLYEAGDFSGAAKKFHQAYISSEGSQAVAFLADKENAVAADLNQQGHTLKEQGCFQQAISKYKSAFCICPATPKYHNIQKLYQNSQAYTHHTWAEKLMGEGKYAEAAIKFQTANECCTWDCKDRLRFQSQWRRALAFVAYEAGCKLCVEGNFEAANIKLQEAYERCPADESALRARWRMLCTAPDAAFRLWWEGFDPYQRRRLKSFIADIGKAYPNTPALAQRDCMFTFRLSEIQYRWLLDYLTPVPGTEESPCSVSFKRQKLGQTSKRYLFVGHRGSGKSTVANTALGKFMFASGPSEGGIDITKVNAEEYCEELNGIVCDTPPLHTVKSSFSLKERQARAKLIEAAFKHDCEYAVIFVLRPQHGLILEEDIHMMESVVAACPTMKFSVIVTQVSAKIETQSISFFSSSLLLKIVGSGDRFHLIPDIDIVRGKINVLLPARDRRSLKNFLLHAPSSKIAPEDVSIIASCPEESERVLRRTQAIHDLRSLLQQEKEADREEEMVRLQEANEEQREVERILRQHNVVT